LGFSCFVTADWEFPGVVISLKEYMARLMERGPWTGSQCSSLQPELLIATLLPLMVSPLRAWI